MHARRPLSNLTVRTAGGMVAAGLIAIVPAWIAAPASTWASTEIKAQAPAPNLAQAQLPKAAGNARQTPTRSTQPAAAREVTRPTWNELAPAQQQALAPLSTAWNTLSEAQKRKWLAMSQNYPSLPEAERTKLRSRMTEWVALTPQQRTQARLNFAETKALAPDDKKAKWEAYQSLSPEEKKKLAAGAVAVKPPPPATAAAVRPVSPQKLARVPATGKSDAPAPRIAAAPNQVDHHTLLPQPGAPDSTR